MAPLRSLALLASWVALGACMCNPSAATGTSSSAAASGSGSSTGSSTGSSSTGASSTGAFAASSTGATSGSSSGTGAGSSTAGTSASSSGTGTTGGSSTGSASGTASGGSSGGGTSGGSSDGGVTVTTFGPATLESPAGVAVTLDGNVLVCNSLSNQIDLLDTSGAATPFAGNGVMGLVDGTGGPDGTAEFDDPNGIAVDQSGNAYVADYGNDAIRKLDQSGNVTTLAGNGIGFADGTGGPSGTAKFYGPWAVAVDSAGNVYVADSENHRVRRVDPNGNVSTVCGSGDAGDLDGTCGGTAALDDPTGIAVDPAGNLYVCDLGTNRIRKIDPSGNATTLAGNGVAGFVDGSGGRNGTAEFAAPSGLAIDGAGNLYVADTGNDAIRKVDPSGNTTTLAGNGLFGHVDGPGSSAEFDWPAAVAVDDAGVIYVGDSFNNCVRKITQ